MDFNEKFPEQDSSTKKHGDKIDDFEIKRKKDINKKKDYKEPSGSSGELPYKTDYDNIPEGTSGSNERRYTNVEKTGSGQAE
ncbi:MAG: hypothetical protein ACK40G_08445 [Cytophagaceae bacterium]